MNSIISATTGSAYGTVPRASQHDVFLDSARELLADAQARIARGEYDLAVESAYRAALRTAGAVIAESAAVAKRKRLPSSAWDKLRITGARGEAWADIFSGYSALRGRVASGIELRPSPTRATALVADATDFYAEVAGEIHGLAAA